MFARAHANQSILTWLLLRRARETRDHTSSQRQSRSSLLRCLLGCDGSDPCRSRRMRARAPDGSHYGSWVEGLGVGVLKFSGFICPFQGVLAGCDTARGIDVIQSRLVWKNARHSTIGCENKAAPLTDHIPSSQRLAAQAPDRPAPEKQLCQSLVEGPAAPNRVKIRA